MVLNTQFGLLIKLLIKKNIGKIISYSVMLKTKRLESFIIFEEITSKVTILII